MLDQQTTLLFGMGCHYDWSSIWTCITSHLSVACQAGLYKAGDMKTCQTCDAGKEPNSDKTACGKKILLWAISSSTYFLDQFYHQFNNQLVTWK